MLALRPRFVAYGVALFAAVGTSPALRQALPMIIRLAFQPDMQAGAA